MSSKEQWLPLIRSAPDIAARVGHDPLRRTMPYAERIQNFNSSPFLRACHWSAPHSASTCLSRSVSDCLSACEGGGEASGDRDGASMVAALPPHRRR